MIHPDHAPWPVVARLTLAVWLVYAATAGGSLGTGDAVAMFEQAKSIVDRGALDVPASQSAEPWRGRDGRYYAPFGIGQSAYDIPWLLLGRAVSSLGGPAGADPDRVSKALVAVGNTVPAAAAVGAGFLLAWLLSQHVAGSLVSAGVLAFGTLLWPYSKYGFNAPLAAATLCAGVYGIARGTVDRSVMSLALGGLALGAALLTRHELVLAAIVSLGWMGVTLRGTPAIRLIATAAAGIVAALVLGSALNMVRFGNPLFTGHTPGFSFAGVTGLTMSPAGSLLLYAPAALAGAGLIPMVRRRHPTAGLLLAVVVVLGTFYATLEDWLGTRSYGPRYLVPLLPILIAPLATWWAHGGRRLKAWIVVLGAACLTMQIPPVAVDFSRAGIAAGQPPQSIRSADWRWAPLLVTSRHAARSIPANVRYLTGVDSPPAASAAPGQSFQARLDFSLDFWWLYLYYLGVLPRPAALLVPVAMLGTAAWLARRAWLLGAAR